MSLILLQNKHSWKCFGGAQADAALNSENPLSHPAPFALRRAACARIELARGGPKIVTRLSP
jgi:hypothetical protein